LNTVFACIFIVAAAYVGAGHLTSRRRVPRVIRRLMGSGFLFIGLGVLLGPQVTGMLSREALVDLEPLLFLSTGWIGLLFGLEMRRRHLTQYPLRWFGGAGLHALLVVVITAVFLHQLTPLIAPHLVAQLSPVVRIMLATLAAVSAPALGHVFHPPEPHHHRLTVFIRFSCGMATLVAVVAFGLLSGWEQGHTTEPSWLLWNWMALPLSIAAAVLLGVLFRLLSSIQESDAESYLVATGFVVLCSGTAIFLGVSTVFTSLVAGVVIGNLPLGSGRRHLRRVLRRLERPMYLMLFLFAGATWQIPLWQTAAVAMLFVAMRYGTQMLAGFVTPAVSGERVPIPLGLGPALLAQGGIALALVLDQRRMMGDESSALLLDAVLLGVLLRGLFRPFRLRRAVAQWEARP
jgi:MFS family permease